MSVTPPRNQTTTAALEDLVSEARLAERWDVTVRTMQRRRKAGNVPPHIRIGRKIFYRVAGVAAFEADWTVEPGGEA